MDLKIKVGEYMVNDRYFKGSIVSNKGTLKNHLNKSHRAILQTLERSIWGIYFPQDLFKKYLDRWEGIPVIYGPQHPDITKFSEDPEAELNRVGVGLPAQYIIYKFNRPDILDYMQM